MWPSLQGYPVETATLGLVAKAALTSVPFCPFTAEQMGDYVTEGGKNSVEVIIGVARRESDLNRETRENRSGDHPGAKPAVLIGMVEIPAVRCGC